MNKQTTALISAHVSVLLFGATGLFGKWIQLPSPIIVSGRVFFATLFLLIVCIALKINLKLKTKKDFFFTLLLGTIWAINLTSFYKSVQVSNVAIASIGFSTFPIFTTFLEPLFFKQKPNKKDLITAFATTIGILLIIPKFTLGNNITLGALYGIVSGLSLASITVLSKKYSNNYSGFTSAFYQNLVATIVLIPIFSILKPNITPHDLGLLALLGTCFSAIPHLLLLLSLKNIKAQTTSIILGLEAVYGILLAMILLNETPSLRTILGGTVILATSAYATFSKN